MIAARAPKFPAERAYQAIRPTGSLKKLTGFIFISGNGIGEIAGHERRAGRDSPELTELSTDLR